MCVLTAASQGYVHALHICTSLVAPARVIVTQESFGLRRFLRLHAKHEQVSTHAGSLMMHGRSVFKGSIGLAICEKRSQSALLRRAELQKPHVPGHPHVRRDGALEHCPVPSPEFASGEVTWEVRMSTRAPKYSSCPPWCQTIKSLGHLMTRISACHHYKWGWSVRPLASPMFLSELDVMSTRGCRKHITLLQFS